MGNGRIINFTFHGLGRPPRPIPVEEEPMWASTDFFRRFLDTVAGRRDVVITFDDGNSSDVDVALPALIERKMRATFFVLAGRMQMPGSVAANDLRALHAAGMTVGLHGMHHVAWRDLSDGELGEELDGARKTLEDVIGNRIDSAACPFGSYDRRSLKQLRGHGFRRVYTSDRCSARSSEWLQPRYTIRADDTLKTVEAILQQEFRRPRWAQCCKMFLKRWR